MAAITAKHFRDLAKLVNRLHRLSSLYTPEGVEVVPMKDVETELADYLAGVNPAFDRARFLAACRGEQ